MEALRDTAPFFTAADLRQRAAGKLLSSDEAAAALTSPAHNAAPVVFRPAAVLIPVIDRRPEATVLLTLRTHDLSVHAGQISFPGGKVDPGDATPAETAFREAEEEIGLGRNDVALIGFFDCFRTNKNFCIAPALGVVAPGFEPEIDRREVAETFEVPLRFLMTPENHKWHERKVDGARRDYYAMPYEGRHIWGVTAGILRSMFERLYRTN
jgi:8-oxo-dGTP pyrophosphatase MutT (NUDIX family)